MLPLHSPRKLLSALAIALLPASLSAQEPVPIGYPTHDILSPFRNPTDVYPPPDELFRQLRVMQNLASRAGDKKSFDQDGREMIDDPNWQRAFAKAKSIGIQAGHLAQMMRLHRNAEQRQTAFYAGFYCTNIDYIIELIAHIPGEPERRTREAALPRAIEFLRAHLGRRFGDLNEQQQAAVRAALPDPDSPMARAQGLQRLPQEADALHSLVLTPYLQLLDVDNSLDQAQALWFLKEVFKIRIDMALVWLEPSLPRIRQLMSSDAPQVRAEAIGLLQVIAPDKLEDPPADADIGALLDWADEAQKGLFPPIRNLNNAIIQLHASPERDVIVTAGIAALENSGIGSPYRGQKKDGSWYRGFRVGHVPDKLLPLAIPKDAVITTVNGAAIGSAQELLQAVELQLKNKRRPVKVLVEYVLQSQSHAVEFRIM